MRAECLHLPQGIYRPRIEKSPFIPSTHCVHSYPKSIFNPSFLPVIVRTYTQYLNQMYSDNHPNHNAMYLLHRNFEIGGRLLEVF